jgi:hypothetical protein
VMSPGRGYFFVALATRRETIRASGALQLRELSRRRLRCGPWV